MCFQSDIELYFIPRRVNNIQLINKLIKIDTNSHNHKNLDIALGIVKSELKGFVVNEYENNGYMSILVHNQNQKFNNKFKIILNGHLDIVPGDKSKYKPIVKGGRIYATGAMDMKAGLVTMIEAFKKSASVVNYPLALQVVTDEEIGGFYGTLHQIKQGVKADFVLSGESTDFDIVNKAKGIIWLKINFKGKTAHGAYPWKGNNAVTQASEFISKIQNKYKNPEEDSWRSSINFANVNVENPAYNKVPDTVNLWVDIRFVPDERRKIMNLLETFVGETGSIEVIADEPAMDVSQNSKLLKDLKLITEKTLNRSKSFRFANGSSDARHYARIGVPAIEFGPTGGGIGTSEEWIDMKSLDKFQEILQNYLKVL